MSASTTGAAMVGAAGMGSRCTTCGRPTGRDALHLEVRGVVLTFRSVDCLRRYLRDEPSLAAETGSDVADVSCWPASEWCL